MRIFNLAEELEKERKKNKELEKELKSIKENYKIQLEYDKQLENRIDKAIEYIETRVDSSKAGKYELLDILEGNNK